MSHDNLFTDFPILKTTSFEVTSPDTTAYNCIAWAAEDTTRNWWPIKKPRYYWPSKKLEETLEVFVEVFSSFGYEICDDSSLESDYTKVAIYCKNSKPTHMARQLTSGKWTSKLGTDVDITHSLKALEGGVYGNVKVLMKKNSP